MSDIRIWHNPRCSKSRAGLAHLQDLQCSFDVFEYTKDKIDAKELADVIKSSDHPVRDFIRMNEKEYKELGLDQQELTADHFAEIAAKHPNLLQRPIIIKDGKAIIARPASRINDILQKPGK